MRLGEEPLAWVQGLLSAPHLPVTLMHTHTPPHDLLGLGTSRESFKHKGLQHVIDTHQTPPHPWALNP